MDWWMIALATVVLTEAAEMVFKFEVNGKSVRIITAFFAFSTVLLNPFNWKGWEFRFFGSKNPPPEGGEPYSHQDC